MGRLEFVTGGARSGKSAFAARRSAELAAMRPSPARVTHVATAVVTDAEMADRIARHRASRPAGWRSVEAPLELGSAIVTEVRRADVVLVDCLAVWASNRLLAIGDGDAPDGPDHPAWAAWWRAVATLEEELLAELDLALSATRTTPTSADLLVVSNEVGFGVVPPTPLGRAFRDLLGRLNQRVATEADAVHLVVAGIALDLRRLGEPEARRGAALRDAVGASRRRTLADPQRKP